MDISDFVTTVKELFPSAIANVDTVNAGVCTWIDLGINNHHFSIQIVPGEGIGFSEIFNDTNPFTGHDKVFQDLESVLELLQSKIQ